jgi:hypothetical protein
MRVASRCGCCVADDPRPIGAVGASLAAIIVGGRGT